MTDEPTLPAADDLDARIRRAVRTLADAAPEPPAMVAGPDGRAALAPAPTGRSRRLALLAAAVIVLLAAVAAILVTRSDSDDTVRAGLTTTTNAEPEPTPAAGPDRPLYGTTWALASARDADGPLPFPTDRPPTVVFDESFRNDEQCLGCEPGPEPAYFYFTGCNWGSGTMRVEGDRIESVRLGAETLAGCNDQVRPLEPDNRAERDPETWSIDGDLLEIRNPAGRVLTYRALPDPLPEREGTVLLDEHEGSVGFRLTWSGEGDRYSMTFDRAVDGVATATARVEAAPGEGAIAVRKAGTYVRDLVYGLVPAEATSVTYVPSKSDPVNLELHDLDGGAFKAVTGLVPAEDQDWLVVAMGDDGHEVGRIESDRLRGSADPFGGPIGVELTRGATNDAQYRLAWDAQAQDLILDRATNEVLPPVRVSVDGTDPDDVLIGIGRTSLRDVVFGVVPPNARRVTFERERGGGEAVELDVGPLPGSTRSFVHGTVPTGPDQWLVRAYDQDGEEVVVFAGQTD